jgi:hypothetical protein
MRRHRGLIRSAGGALSRRQKPHVAAVKLEHVEGVQASGDQPTRSAAGRPNVRSNLVAKKILRPSRYAGPSAINVTRGHRIKAITGWGLFASTWSGGPGVQVAPCDRDRFVT